MSAAAIPSRSAPPLWTRGDLNAFFGLGINMLVNVLVLTGLAAGVVQISGDDVFGVILPALGIELLVGNIFYFYMARAPRAMKEGRSDVTALPYGPSVPHMFIVTFVVMLPTFIATKDPIAGLDGRARMGLHHRRHHPHRRLRRPDDPQVHAARRAAGHAGGHLDHVHLDGPGRADVAGRVDRPAGACPHRHRLRRGREAAGQLPDRPRRAAARLARSRGPAASWRPLRSLPRRRTIAVGIPSLNVDLLIDGLEGISPLLATAIPLGIYNFTEAMSNVESRRRGGRQLQPAPRAAGRRHRRGRGLRARQPVPARRLRRASGLEGRRRRRQLLAGHRRAIFVLCFFGLFPLLGALLPVPAIVPVLLYIGLVIGAQAFSAVPKAHHAAIVLALVPNIAAWASGLIDNSLAAAGTSAGEGGAGGAGQRRRRLRGAAETRPGGGACGPDPRCDRGLHDRPPVRLGRRVRFLAAILALVGLIHGAEVPRSRRTTSRLKLALGYAFMALVCLAFGSMKSPSETSIRQRSDDVADSPSAHGAQDARRARPGDARVPASVSIERLLAGYRDGSEDPEEVAARAYERARSAAQPAWISLAPWSSVRAGLDRLRAGPADLPLYGIPFAIKDNIDLAGTPTTAGCPAYAYVPERSAVVVQRLVAAGAIPIGKTNMDQFATGLTGTRTPYGACASVADPRYIAGGSSAGSAVVVADGTVPFALGTDTAGSGRVPAALNAIVGLKPSIGLLSTTGVVPACRGLDCVSLLCADVADAARVLDVAAGADAADPYSRVPPPAAGERLAWGAAGARLAVPRPDGLSFFGDGAAARAWERSRERAVALGWEVCEIDLEPFLEVARMLYEGPWPAARYAAVGAFVAAHPAEVDPIVRAIIMAGRDIGAVEVFEAAHRLGELRLATRAVWESADALLLPTTPTLYTAAQIAEEPVARNAVLGTYTNFVNLLDLCAIAIPGAAREDGLPFGVSLVAPAGAEPALLRLAARFRDEQAGRPADAPADTVAVAVVGAHLSGEPLNGQLLALGGRLLETTRTAPTYRLFELPGSVPAKPGLVGGGVATGAGIEVELWELSTESFGRLTAGVSRPLAIGTVQLADGRAVKGFICEADAVDGAREITAHGGWRAYLAAARATRTTRT